MAKLSKSVRKARWLSKQNPTQNPFAKAIAGPAAAKTGDVSKPAKY